ncbi:MAG: hypothetical protein MJ132_06520 [Clostridia bacterium]|nr:hypothetical protein [Clostridia bacterium]
MKKQWLMRLCAIGLVLSLSFNLVGCSKKITGDYRYQKQKETGLYFYSSSPDLDRFLNDYFDRHSRRNEKTAINDMQLGTEGSAWKAWDALSLLWFDSTSSDFRQDSFALMKNWLYTETVDDYGYAWTKAEHLDTSDSQGDANTFGMGWPFPNYDGSGDYDWEFNSYNNYEGWSVSTDGRVKSSVDNGLLTAALSGAHEVSFVKNPEKGKIYTEESPFLEFDFRWALQSDAVEGVYVTWKNADESVPHTVNAKDYSVLSNPLARVINRHFYLAMYRDANWGTDRVITDLTITVKAKSGRQLDGDINLNFVRGNYDSRQIDNGYCYLEAAKMYYEFTGDTELLQKVIGNCAKITAFMIYNLDGESGLCDLSNFVGHDGGVIDDGIPHTIASSYWDVLSLSPKSLYAQILYYRILQDMADLLNAAAQVGVTMPKETIKLFSGGTRQCDFTAEQLYELGGKVKNATTQNVDLQNKTGFFDEKKGRFIEGFNMRGDVVDYGSTVFNDMAVWSGLATEKQAKSIVEWLSGKRTVEGDDSTGKDIYKFRFAPRTTTVKNSIQYTTGHANEASFPYGSSVQDGGAIAFTSFYDIMMRLKVTGTDDAFKRLTDIQKWYLEVYDYSAKNFGSSQFYRAYYQQKGLALQGGGTAGALGLDTEFLENAILYATVPFGFFGLNSSKAGVLTVNPSLPKALTFWRMENLMFCGVKYDLEIGSDYVLLESVRGNTAGLCVEVCMKTTVKQPKVYIGDQLLDASKYTVSGGTVTVSVPFTVQKITIR